MAVRIQRRRVKGWRMPPDTVSVTRPGRWGNPFLIGGSCCFGGSMMLDVADHYSWIRTHPERMYAHVPDAATAVAWFRELLIGYPYMVERAQRDLRGKNLACWCRLDQPCHADVLLEVANASLACEAV